MRSVSDDVGGPEVAAAITCNGGGLHVNANDMQ